MSRKVKRDYAHERKQERKRVSIQNEGNIEKQD
jgi:hypothetical protein